MTARERIRELSTQKGIKQKHICASIGVAESFFADWKNGKTSPSEEKLEKIAEILGTTVAYLKGETSEVARSLNVQPSLESIGATPYHPAHKIPVLGRISAGLPLYADEQIEGYIHTDLNGNHEYYALRVQGDSMNNRHIEDGSTVIIQRDADIVSGDIAVVMVGDSDATIKQFFRNGPMVTLVPHSNNPAHITQVYHCEEVEVKLLGKLVRVIIDF